jgi:DNA-directed RNA polymerase specialized sigma24 family protein
VGPTDISTPRSREEETLLADLRMTIDDLTRHLSGTQKRIIQMRLDGEEVQAIADATQRSKRTVERTLQMFREELRGVIQ